MGITVTLVGEAGFSIGIDWGAAIGFGIMTAIRHFSSNNQDENRTQLNNFAYHIYNSFRGREEFTQTVYKSEKSNYDESLFDTSSNYHYINQPYNREKEEEEEKEITFKGCLNNNEINEFDKSFYLPNHRVIGVNNFNLIGGGIKNNNNFIDLENMNFERYIRAKAFPSLNSSSNYTDKNVWIESGFTFGKKVINTSTQTHIIDLLIEKTIKNHYYLNSKNKKIMDEKNFKIFRENNLDALHLKKGGLKIFNGIMNFYDMGNKIYKINSIITDIEKKNSHKVVEVSLEGGKIAIKNYFLKHYFLNTLKNTQKGIKKINNIYKTSKLVKTAKNLVKGGSIGTGIVITLILDELIEGTCNLLGRGLEKTIDKFEDKK